ncbi:MAG: hypothetical protein NTX25_17425 [Proteobacteria bacterium]|nr:hypothetical protein [Pseudomonadota bacterium]
MKAVISALIAASLFGGSQRSDRLRPDLRHWSENLYQAAPSLEDFEDFLSDLDLDDDPDDLEADQKKRISELKALESIELAKESPGRGFLLAKQMVEISFKISSYQRMIAERDFYYASNQWRLQDPALLQNLRNQGDLEQTSLKAVGFARNLVNSYSFEPDYSQYLLIRLLARTRNSNLFLFYDQFKKKFPNSYYSPHVNQFIADYYFAQHDWDKAETLIKAVINNKDTPIRPYAIYKLAWLHIMRAQTLSTQEKRSEQLTQAQTALRLCIKLMKEWDHYTPVFKLKREAAIDLAWIHAELRTPNSEVLHEFEDNKLKEAYLSFLRYLAVDAIRDGDSQRAESAFAEYLPMVAMQRQLPQDLMSQIELFLLNRSFDKVLEAYKKIRALYQDKSEWCQEWHSDELLIKHSERQLANHLALTAMKLQQEAEAMTVTSSSSTKDKSSSTSKSKLSKQELMALSRSYYDLFMEWYPDSDARDDARYNYALVIFQNGEAERAIKLLTEITLDPKSTHHRDAAYSLILAVANWDAQQSLPKLPEAAKGKVPVPLTKSKALLVEKIDAFTKSWPDAEENIPALYTAAQTFFDFAHYDEASKRFDIIIKMAVEAGRWEELIPICKGYLANKEILAAGHRKLIKQTLDYAKSQSPK